jgi:hypothetical protein
MNPTKTINELGEQVLGQTINQAVDEVDCDLVSTADDLAQKYLSPDVNQSFRKVDVKSEELGINVVLKDFKFQVHARGLWLTLVVTTIISLLIGSEQAQTILKNLVSHLHI